MNDNEKILIDNDKNEVEFLEEEVVEQYRYVKVAEIESYKGDLAVKALFMKAMMEKNEQYHKKDNKKHGAFVKYEDNE